MRTFVEAHYSNSKKKLLREVIIRQLLLKGVSSIITSLVITQEWNSETR